MSVLTYNGITLPYCLTEKFLQNSVYEDSNTDRYLTNFDITVQCVLNFNMLDIISDTLFTGIDAQSPATIMNVIRQTLLQARKNLSFQFNGMELIPQAQSGLSGTVDAKNGPQPRECTLTDLTNNTFLLHYRIEANYWENNSITSGTSNGILNLPGNNVLYNRWSESVEIDEKMYSKRTREGKFIIRSDNYAGLLADQIRTQMAVVSVPDGFLRESSKYIVTPDGLGLQYTIVDKEVFKYPPAQTYKASGNYTERATMLGAVRYGTARVRLEGSKISSQSDLIRLAVYICRTLINIRVAQTQSAGVILVEATVSRDLYENNVECFMVGQMQAGSGSQSPGPDSISAIAAFAGMSTYTPGSDAFNVQNQNGTQTQFLPAASQPVYFDRGTASLLLQAAKYYDPNLQTTKLGPTNKPTGSNAVTKTGAQAQQLTQGLDVGTAGQIRES